MKRFSFLLIGVLFCSTAIAQSVQWASKVLDFSTEFADKRYPGQYVSKEVLGPPSTIDYRSKGQAIAWNPSNPDSPRDEYIKVGFKKPMRIKQIAINENYGAGAISKVILFSQKGKPIPVYTNPAPGKLAVSGRMFNIFLPEAVASKSVMVVLKTSSVPGFNQIDAIGISAGLDTIKGHINLAEGLTLDGKRENLGPNINSEHEELLPVISPDGKMLYYTRQGHPNNVENVDAQDVWYAPINPDGSYALSKNIGAPINTKENNAATSISPDGQSMLLLNKYLPDGTVKTGVSIARREGDSWGKPLGLEIDNYYNRNSYGEYCLSSSGKTIVMAIERDDGIGSKDIYVSFLKEDGRWSKPLHTGNVINSAASETSPYLAADDATMYFATDGFPGYGKKDMFVTRRLDDSWTKWSQPENLGPLLNSENWDAYYSIPASGEYAYFVSYGNSMGGADIFRAPLPKILRPKPVVLITGKVLNSITKEPISADIIYEALGLLDKELGIANSDNRDGSYSIVLPAGEEYGFLANAKGFFPLSEYIDLRELNDYQEINRDLLLAPLEKGNTIRLNNLFFDTGKWELRTQSLRELGRLEKMLNENPTIAIEIAGHTDDVGAAASNLELSKKRARAVLTYLTDKGINASRLKAAGYGETKPQVPNSNAENQQINRRVEFTIKQL